MTTQLKCPACQAFLKLAKAIAPGKLIRCPKCMKTVRVPEEADEELEPARPAKKASAIKKPTRPPVVHEEDEELEEAPAPPAKKSLSKKPIRNRDDEDEEEPEARRPKKSRKDKIAKDSEGNSGLVRNLIGAGVLLVLLVVLAVVFISRWSVFFPNNADKKDEPVTKIGPGKKGANPDPKKPLDTKDMEIDLYRNTFRLQKLTDVNPKVHYHFRYRSTFGARKAGTSYTWVMELAGKQIPLASRDSNRLLPEGVVQGEHIVTDPPATFPKTVKVWVQDGSKKVSKVEVVDLKVEE